MRARLAPLPPIQATKAIQYGQVFTSGIPDLNVLVGTRGMAWNIRRPIAGLYSLNYAPAFRVYFNTPQGGWLAWLYVNHPDWISYQTDRTTVTSEYGDTKYPQVDISNPAVRDYLANSMIVNSHGWNGIGLDNVTPQNNFKTAGHYAGTVTPCASVSRPACGGTWTQQYSGKSEVDVAWTRDVTNYIRTLRQKLATSGLTLLLNENYAFNVQHVAINRAASGSMAEGFPQHGCETTANDWKGGRVVDGLWAAMMPDLANDTKGWWFSVSYLCDHGISGITKDEEEWNIAAYLLFEQNRARNYLSVDRQGTTTYANYPPSMEPPVGPYADAIPLPGTCGGVRAGADLGVCSRKFYADAPRTHVNAIVVVNSSGENTLKYSIPASPGGWTDLFCNPMVAGPLAMAPATGLVLVATRRDETCAVPQP